MATRKDLLKAQSFTTRRMIASFVDRDPDNPTPPLKRVATATFVSVLLGVVLLAGTALLGLLGGGAKKDAWQDEQNVILADGASGALFVKLGDNIIPMADVASARLLAAGKDADGPPRVIDIATDSMLGQSLQPEQGIPGAPRQLPDAKALESYPIRLCSTAPTGRGRYLTLEFGQSDITTQAAIVVRTSDRTEYLLSDGRLHRLYSRAGQPSGLAQNLPRVEPGNSWISSLPLGPEIEPKPVPGYGGQAESSTRNFLIGQMAVVAEPNGQDRYYIQLNDGLSRIAYLDMQLIQQQERDEGEPTKISDEDVVANRSQSQETFSAEGTPMGQPEPPTGYTDLTDASVCVTFADGDPERVALSVGQATPSIGNDAQAPSGRFVDFISSAPMKGALLRNADTYSDEGASVLLLNTLSYAIPTISDRRALGYGDVTPMAVPGPFLSLLRPGLEIDGLGLSRESVIPVHG